MGRATGAVGGGERGWGRERGRDLGAGGGQGRRGRRAEGQRDGGKERGADGWMARWSGARAAKDGSGATERGRPCRSGGGALGPPPAAQPQPGDANYDSGGQWRGVPRARTAWLGEAGLASSPPAPSLGGAAGGGRAGSGSERVCHAALRGSIFASRRRRWRRDEPAPTASAEGTRDARTGRARETERAGEGSSGALLPLAAPPSRRASRPVEGTGEPPARCPDRERSGQPAPDRARCFLPAASRLAVHCRLLIAFGGALGGVRGQPCPVRGVASCALIRVGAGSAVPGWSWAPRAEVQERQGAWHPLLALPAQGPFARGTLCRIPICSAEHHRPRAGPSWLMTRDADASPPGLHG